MGDGFPMGFHPNMTSQHLQTISNNSLNSNMADDFQNSFVVGGSSGSSSGSGMNMNMAHSNGFTSTHSSPRYNQTATQPQNQILDPTQNQIQNEYSSRSFAREFGNPQGVQLAPFSANVQNRLLGIPSRLKVGAGSGSVGGIAQGIGSVPVPVPVPVSESGSGSGWVSVSVGGIAKGISSGREVFIDQNKGHTSRSQGRSITTTSDISVSLSRSHSHDDRDVTGSMPFILVNKDLSTTTYPSGYPSTRH